MQRLSNTLSNWSRAFSGDIHVRVKDFKEKVRIAEDDMMLHNSDESRTNLHKLNVEYIKILRIEESILKPKSQLN